MKVDLILGFVNGSRVHLSALRASICVLAVALAGAPALGQQSDLSNADGDSDGTVTVKEFQDYAASRLPGFERLEAFAKKVDENGDGKISSDEFAGRMQILQRMNEPDDDQPSATTKPSSEQIKAAKAAYTLLKKSVKKSNWSQVAELMTKQGQDEFCVDQILGALGMAKAEMPMEIPAVEDAIDEINDVLIKHGLDKLDLDIESTFRFHIGGDDEDENREDNSDQIESSDSDGDSAKQPADEKTSKEVILGVLDKDNQRWTIIGDVYKAYQASPFAMSHLTGRVEKVEFEDGHALLEIKLLPPDRDEEGGVSFQFVSPPVVLRFANQDGEWKFDGRDLERTAKAAKDFMKNMPGQSGGARSDF